MHYLITKRIEARSIKDALKRERDAEIVDISRQQDSHYPPDRLP